ncbi:MAG: DUF4403 family protein [Synergistaceae bacterium]|nr:DUF4403 family protein [Synergistaceae bacterium]
MNDIEYSTINPDGSAARFHSLVFYDEDSLAAGNFSGFVTIFPVTIDYRDKTRRKAAEFLHEQMAIELAAQNFLVWVVDYQDEYSNTYIYPVLDRPGARVRRSLAWQITETLTPVFTQRLQAAATALQNSAYGVCAQKLPHYISGGGIGANMAFLSATIFPPEWKIVFMNLTSAFTEPTKYEPKLLEHIDRTSLGISFMHSPNDSVAPLSAVQDLVEILKGRNINAKISAFNPPSSLLADEESAHSLYVAECMLQRGNEPSPMAQEIIAVGREEKEIPPREDSSIEQSLENIKLCYDSDSFVRLRVDLKYRDIVDIFPGLFSDTGHRPSLSGKTWSGGGYSIDFDVNGAIFEPAPGEKDAANISIPFGGRLYQKILGTEVTYDGFSGNLKIGVTSEITPEWEASLRLIQPEFSVDGLSGAALDLISLLDSIGVDLYETAKNWLDNRMSKLSDTTRFSLREIVSEGWERLQSPARISIKDHPDMFLNVTPDFLAIDPLRFSSEKMSLDLALKAGLELSTLPRDTGGSIKALPSARRVPEGPDDGIILRVPVTVRFKELNELFAAMLAQKIHHRDGLDRSFILFIPEAHLSGGTDGTLVLRCSAKVEFFRLLTFRMVNFSLPVHLAYDVKNQLLYLKLHMDDKAGKDLEKQLSRFVDEKTGETVRNLILLLAGDRKIVYNIAPSTARLDERIDEEIRKYADGLLILDDTYSVVSGIEGLTIDDEGIRLKSFFRGKGISVDAMGFLMLMAAETNPQFRDAKGRTLLSRAILDNRTVLVEELIKRGVDPSAADFQGKRAVDFAKERDRGDIVELIENASLNK